MPNQRLARVAPTGLRRRLIFLVFASVLPFLLLIGVAARRQLVEQKPVAAGRALARASGIAGNIDAFFRDIESTAQALTYSIGADVSDRAANDRVLQDVSSNIPHEFTSWQVFTPGGRLIGSSSSDSLPDTEYSLLVARSTAPGATRFITEPVHLPSVGHAVHMFVPMRDARGNRALLVAQIPLRALRPLLHAPDLPEGSSVAVISERGVIVARSPDPERWVGYDIGGTPLDSAANAAVTRPVEFTTQDSVRRLLAVTRMSEAPWRVGAGIPASALFAKSRGDFARTLGYGGLALVLALGLALWQGTRIVEPIKRLSVDAAKLGTGNLAHRSDVAGSDEFAVLASTINEMADTLEQQGTVLRESEERYRGLFDINPLPMWVFDPGTLGFVAVNRAAIEAYGYSEEEFLKMTILDLKAAEDIPELREHLVAAAERHRKYATRHRRKDGTFIEVELDAGAIIFGGKSARLVVANDVSERVRSEEALRNAEVQLRQSQRLEAIGQLTGGIAHDFNNVLTAIGSYSDFLYESLEPGDARRLDIQEIRKAAERAAGLTKQLLAFSRSQILQPRVIDVNASLGDLELLLRRVVTADIDLRFALDSGVGHVRADPGQLAQVVINLAVNARDAMPDGGVLQISSRNESVGEPSADALDAPIVRPGPYVIIEVRDTGVGMDHDTVQRIFEPFFTTKGPGKGTGLGLSTVHGIVLQSGGYVSVDSAPGEGTTFTIRLPRVDQPVEPERPKSPRADAGHRSETILVVEDEEAVRRAAKRILVKKGYTVIEASDGNEALQIIHAQPKIDLLLTDLVMPGMGGRELVRELRERSRVIPTLYMSGYTKDAVMRAELDPDIAVLEKPFSQDELASKVREVLDNNDAR